MAKKKRSKDPKPKNDPKTSIEPKSFRPFVTFLILSLISFVLSFFIYMAIVGIGIGEIADEWDTIINGWFSPESLFFLLFFGMIFILSVGVHFYNQRILILYKKENCKLKKGKWDKKKKICN